MPHARERVLPHPLRDRLLFEYAAREASPSDLARRLALPLNLVSWHTGVLVRSGALELVRTERRRGGTAHVYRAAGSPLIEDEEWSAIAPPLRRRLVRELLAVIADESRAAGLAGGFDPAQSHLWRWPLELDEAGWRAITLLLRQLVDDLAAVQAAADTRADAPARQVDVVLMGFEVTHPAVPQESVTP